MIKILEHHSLKSYNTFGIDTTARYFVSVENVDELREALLLKGYPKKFILGGGSNILLTKAVDALVIHIAIKGIVPLWEDEQQIALKVMAGEVWHPFVLWTIQHGYGGLENLSLIPGNVGTAPIQNIGAYGVELKDVFLQCDAMSMDTAKIQTFSKEECQFGYRDSYFKSEGIGKYVITAIVLVLTKKTHVFNTSYGAIKEELTERGITEPDIQDISNAVIAIRQSKLPDPSEIGNSGSFFKNPVISEKTYQALKTEHTDIPGYPQDDGSVKIPAGWLIEQCGFKGTKHGNAGVYEKQALVLINLGNATGKELLDLALTIKSEVHKKFGIHIQPEVNIIPHF